MGKMKLLLLVVLAAFFAASTGFAAETSFKAKLSPKDEVPSHKTKASGKAEFKLSKDGKELSYKLHVKNIMNASAAHIHKGKKGENGPPLVGLFSGEKKEKFSGMLSEGVITDKDLLGELQGKTVADLVQVMRSGETYVNVHTDAFPDGEIRGQIK
jgi:Cu/Zn superoxide dismutase